MDGHGGRLQILGALALVLGSLAVAVGIALRSPEVAYLPPSPEAPWITDPRPVNSNLQQWGRERPPQVHFVARFKLESVPAEARLSARAVRHFRIVVNDEAFAPSEPNARWRDGLDADVAPALREGVNELRIEVTNRYGPSLASLRLQVDPPLVSGSDFVAFVDGERRGRAVPADDTRPEMWVDRVETPLQGLASRRTFLAGLLVGACALAIAGFRLGAALPAARVPQLVLGFAGVSWIVLFARKVARIPLEVGFDARHHLQYVDFIREGRLPLATDGWSTFHPPLFYLLAAPLRDGGTVWLRALPWFAGLAAVGVVWLAARRMHADRPAIVAWAVAFAAALPVHLYSSAYFTNESLHALFTSLGLWLTLHALSEERISRATLVWIGICLGLAAITKFTVLALVPVVLFFFVVRLWRLESVGLREASVQLAAIALPFLAISGWYYVRNFALLGVPVQGNWGHLPGVQAWWQQPGFHTWEYYTRFGEVLRHGYFAGFVSLWDGAYGSFWGDGLLGGVGTPSYRHDFWSYDFMSAGFLLALPLTALLALGMVVTLHGAFTCPTPRRRVVFSFELTAIYALVYSFATLTLSLPYFSQAKSSYLLPLLVLLALAFGRGVGAVDRQLQKLGPEARGVFAGAVATGLACLWLGFGG